MDKNLSLCARLLSAKENAKFAIIKKKMAIGYCDERGKCMKVGAQDANLETLPIWLQHAIWRRILIRFCARNLITVRSRVLYWVGAYDEVNAYSEKNQRRNLSDASHQEVCNRRDNIKWDDDEVADWWRTSTTINFKWNICTYLNSERLQEKHLEKGIGISGRDISQNPTSGIGVSLRWSEW